MKHISQLQVRFSDTDMMGHVNNARYFTFMEEARIYFFQEVVGQESGLPLILASAAVNFRAQTFFGETLRVESWVSRWGKSSFDVAVQMYGEETGTLVFDGVSVLVHFDYEQQKPRRIPDEYRRLLSPYTELDVLSEK